MLTGVGFAVASSIGGGHAGGDSQFTIYRTRLDQLYTKVQTSRIGRALGLHPEREGDSTAGGQTLVSYVVPYIGNGIGQVAGVSSHTATVLLLMAFLLYGRRWDADPADGGRRGGLVPEIEARVQQYISVTVLISALTGIFVGVALGFLGVQFAGRVRPPGGGADVHPQLRRVPGDRPPRCRSCCWTRACPSPVKILAFAIPGGIQLLIGSVVQPKLTGQSLDLHPVVILLSLLFFTMIWGVGRGVPGGAADGDVQDHLREDPQHPPAGGRPGGEPQPPDRFVGGDRPLKRASRPNCLKRDKHYERRPRQPRGRRDG